MYFDVIFDLEPTAEQLDGVYASHKTTLYNPAGNPYATFWHCIVTEEQWQIIFNEWPAQDRPKNPVAANAIYFRDDAGPGNWISYHAYGPGRDRMVDATEEEE